MNLKSLTIDELAELIRDNSSHANDALDELLARYDLLLEHYQRVFVGSVWQDWNDPEMDIYNDL